jgi:hypothetical protein
MQNTESNQRRWGSFEQLKQQYPVGKTRAYELLKCHKLKAKKLGRRTIWDLDSAEAFFASLPDYERGA